MSLLGKARDKAVEAIIRKNEFVKRFGDIQSLSINSDQGYADVVVLLHGEKEPITFRGYYSFNDMDKDTELCFTSISCGRRWIDDLLSYWLEGHTLSYTIPGLAGGLAKIFF
ncbi:MAG: hypothetical protein K6E57_02530 [Fibrobacter sp.]|uniref:hypothetical protein n=1 Tax=Fibrobacter sp. UWP2 TaxID=1896216 RepID=UPI00091AD97E|nr:hypothetical protein [Fibrobacter sp. UWP2]MBO7384588.1 hypothetical protein [Fibrobacter sp.]MCR5377824.1 hypothetical protein [Fibrobacter sp.]SHI33015.1 hypothetical protein SAMN05720471_101189 [Fibrobacter sp. UWP2]